MVVLLLLLLLHCTARDAFVTPSVRVRKIHLDRFFNIRIDGCSLQRVAGSFENVV